MQIDKNWRIEPDGLNCTLIFSEERESIDKEGNKTFKVFEDPYFHPTVYSALKSYLNKQLEPSKDVQDCVQRIEETYAKIEKLCSQK